jgi:hypothetical protein
MSKKSLTVEERRHIGRVKELPCSCCGAPGPSIAHHAREEQGTSQRGGHYCTIALCESCHVSRIGIHGDKTMMRIMNLTEMDMLNITIERLSITCR